MTDSCVIPVSDGCPNEMRRPLLCEMHRLQLLDRVRAVPVDARTVLALLGHTTTPAEQRVSGSRDPVLPAATWLGLAGPVAAGPVWPPVEPDDHVDAPVLDLLGSWARLVAEERSVELPSPPPSLDGLVTVCAFLARHHDWVCEQPWVSDYWTEVTEAWNRTRSAAGSKPARRKSNLPCASCGMRGTLVQADSREPYRCVVSLGGCGYGEPDDDHEARLAVMQTEAEVRGIVEQRLSA